MTVALFILAVACLVGLTVYCARSIKNRVGALEAYFEQRSREQDEADEGRRQALYKQQKVANRTIAQTDRAVKKMADEARNLHENARLMQERADTMLKEARRGE